MMGWFVRLEKLGDVKALKENFVSNLEGTTFKEVLVVTLIIPCAFILRKSVSGCFPYPSKSPLALREEEKTWRALLVDFAAVVVPGVLGLTMLSDHSGEMCVMLLILACVGVVRTKQTQQVLGHAKEKRYGNGSPGSFSSPPPRKAPVDVIQSSSFVWDSLTEYRSILCLYTFISILAVDFKIFPRRFAKAEHYGTGLMDVGVGSFIVSDALFTRADTPSKGRGLLGDGKKQGLWNSLQLAAVGMLRIIAVKAISYHEHVGEYGVHWNFFLTLAVVKLFALAIPTKACGLLGITIAVSYQTALVAFGVNAYVNTHDRDWGNLFSLNKEGIISLVGYASLHCLARFFACFSKMRTLTELRRTTQDQKRSTVYTHVYCTIAFTAVCWGLGWFLDASLERVSRRSVNAAYIFWVLANNLTWLCTCYLARLVLDQYQKLHLFRAVNKFAFVTFIVANLLVGLVNSMGNTLEVKPALAVATTCLYMLMICVISHVLYTNGPRFHFSRGKLLFTSGKILHSPESEL
mmetsp:Transcript_28083/g.59267  ORF Transcript_28083/g.59267 Transcript_28083/m.59267 type:complete len:520 (-) Transcript_28083:1395-2954(-)